MDKKIYTCKESFGRDGLVVRPAIAKDAVVFRGGSRREGLKGGFSGLDVYVSNERLPDLIAQLQEHLDEEKRIAYKEELECEYSGDMLIVEHTRAGVLPEFIVSDGENYSASIFLTRDRLLRLRDLIDLSVEKIEEENYD